MEKRTYRYYDLVMASFVCVLLCANVIGVKKVTTLSFPLLGEITFGAGILFFPLSYLFGDILTEVYGYARARRVVWTGFAALAFAALMSWVIVALPPSKDWAPNQAAYVYAYGSTPRIVLASVIAFFWGELSNSYVLAKMKIWTEGKHLWARTIGSTMAGEAVDTLIFYPIAFYGVWSNNNLVKVMIANYILKVLWEVFATPITYRVVSFLKRVEHEDFYDRETDFTPFSMKVS
ncbi:MAG: queuosine precursor transporter [Myxococcales bacterium]|nr:queuosine precursor transporter [Myxococcales bacterium]